MFVWLFAIFANLPYANFGEDAPLQQIVTWVVAFLYLMVVFYLFYLVLAPKFLNRKKIAEFFALSFVVVLIMPFFGYTILFFIRAIFDGTFQNFYSWLLFKNAYERIFSGSYFSSISVHFSV